jgi:hypothetical protein
LDATQLSTDVQLESARHWSMVGQQLFSKQLSQPNALEAATALHVEPGG